MKNITTLSFITIIFLGFTGCGGSSPSSSSSGTVQGTAYLAFSPDTSKRLDVLYKTDGTTSNTLEISNAMLPSNPSQYEYELLNDFLIYGNNLYTDRVQKRNNCLFFCIEREQMITNLSSGTTNPMALKTSSSLGNIKNAILKRYITSNGMYMSHKDLSSSYTLEKYNISSITATGIISTIPISSTYSPNVLTGHVQVNEDIYYAAKDYSSPNITLPSTYGLLKLDTNTNVVSEIVSARGLQLSNMSYLNGKIYAQALTDTSGGLYMYDPTTPNTPPSLIVNYQEVPSHSQVINGKLYYLASTISGARTLYELDPNNGNSITAHANVIHPSYFKNIFTYNGLIYYNDGSTLRKLDGTQVVALPDGEVYEANGKLYFAGSGNNGIELFQYDGTTVSMVLDINSGAGDSIPRHITELNGAIVFQASPDGVNNKLYKYDGSTLSLLN